jgi:hypothetical protein
MVMEIGNVNNSMAGMVAGAAKAEEVEKKGRKVALKETAPKAVAPAPDMPNPAQTANNSQDSTLVSAFSELLKEIDDELKNKIAANIKRATKEEISPKAREHLKSAFDHLKTVHKQVQEMAAQIS